MDEKEVVLIIKGTISELPETEQEKVMGTYRKLRTMVDGDPITALAIALIGAEIAAL